MAIQCAICGRFISFQDFTEGRTVMVETQSACFMEPPEDAPAHRACHERARTIGRPIDHAPVRPPV